MTDLFTIENYCNDLLNSADFDDYCPNGVQVQASDKPVRRLVSGVTACQALIDEAVAWEADLLLVHHGFFWKGESQVLTGPKGNRIRILMQNETSLLAYHLPLDAHPQLGNNCRLGELLAFENAAPLKVGGLVWCGELPVPHSAEKLTGRIGEAVSREPLCIKGGEGDISKVAWCSGAAQGAIEEAAAAGADAFISGEISESTVHLARELGIHYFAAGHHATECGGCEALGEHLSEQFGIEHRFIDIANPV